MNTFIVALRTDNAAFEDRPHEEVARILRELADDVLMAGGLRAGHSGYLSDINGNTVGRWDAGEEDHFRRLFKLLDEAIAARREG